MHADQNGPLRSKAASLVRVAQHCDSGVVFSADGLDVLSIDGEAFDKARLYKLALMQVPHKGRCGRLAPIQVVHEGETQVASGDQWTISWQSVDNRF
jgi:hypothetical protein